MTTTRPPTLPRDLRVTIADLEAIAHKATRLARLLPDAHVLAYEQQRSGDLIRGATKSEWYLDEQGQADAKDALRALKAERGSFGAKVLLDALGAHLDNVEALFRGPSADATLRGTLLGDERGNGAQRELTEALKAQERRGGRHEYTPARSEPQPKRVPGA